MLSFYRLTLTYFILSISLTMSIQSVVLEQTEDQSTQETIEVLSKALISNAKSIDRLAKTLYKMKSSIVESVKAELVTALKVELELIKQSQSQTTTETIVEEITHHYENGEISQDCCDLQLKGNNQSGLYSIKLGPNNVEVYCDMSTRGGGWTVFQRREQTMGPKINFYRKWIEYENGFGSANSTHWLGLKHITELTKSDNQKLRIDLHSFAGKQRYAEYEGYIVAGPSDNYRLNISGYAGNAGDCLIPLNGMQFSTLDQDNDKYGVSCAIQLKGGWWYNNCGSSNLNGIYFSPKQVDDTSNYWYYMDYGSHSLLFTEMKLRNKNYPMGCQPVLT